MARAPGENMSFGADTGEQLRQSILCLLEISRSGRTATMLSVITGRARKEVLTVLGAMAEAGEVALEELPSSTRATITPDGKAALRAEIGHMMVLTRLLVEDSWGEERRGAGAGGEGMGA